MTHLQKQSRWPWAALISIVFAAGCATTSSDSPDSSDTDEMAVVVPAPEFLPMEPRAHVAAANARYRNLYAPESNALWVTSLVAREKQMRDETSGVAVSADLMQAAEVATRNFIVIECRLESEFADSSVAYDAVGMRSVDVFLENANGMRVSPLQRVVGTHADETPVRALVRFGRTTYLIFPKSVSQGTPGGSAPAQMRLVLEGYHSTFYFPWFDASSSGVQLSAVSSTDASDSGFVEIFSRLRRIVDIIN